MDAFPALNLPPPTRRLTDVDVGDPREEPDGEVGEVDHPRLRREPHKEPRADHGPREQGHRLPSTETRGDGAAGE